VGITYVLDTRLSTGHRINTIPTLLSRSSVDCGDSSVNKSIPCDRHYDRDIIKVLWEQRRSKCLPGWRGMVSGRGNRQGFIQGSLV
jgi:hypothetical protein